MSYSTTQSITKYHPDDLRNHYVHVFFRTWIHGGLKGVLYPVDTTEWIIRARYLLTEVEDEHIDALFEHGKKEGDGMRFVGAASWIAALLKKEKYIDKIGEYALKGGDEFFSPTYYACLLLFDNPIITLKYLLEFIENNSSTENDYHNDGSKSLAVYALQLYDQKYKTKHSEPFHEIEVSPKRQKRIDGIINYTNLLRANISFNVAKELQTKLKILLNDTVSPFQYVKGLLSPPVFEKMDEQELKVYTEKIRTEYKAANAQGLKYNLNTDLRNTKKRKNTEDFELVRYTSRYLSDISDKENIDTLNGIALITRNPADILAALEMDISYKLPMLTILILFEKLFSLVNPSYQLYELYSLHLLLRGSQMDEKARGLYEQACVIKENYESYEGRFFFYLERYSYTMFKESQKKLAEK